MTRFIELSLKEEQTADHCTTSRPAIVAVGRRHQFKGDDRDSGGVVHRGVSSTILKYGGGLQLRL
jgi:hypothetical protein